MSTTTSQASHPAARRSRAQPRRAGHAAFLALCALLAAAADVAPAADDATWFAHGYVARFSANRFNQIVRLETEPRDSWLAALGVGRRLSDLTDHTLLEWEVNAAKHWGMQDHSEVNTLLAVRWHGFPWDATLRNTIALGLGASYAFEVPAIEEEGSDESTHLLQYLMLDVTAAAPGWRDWALFLRTHHRSGTFGVIAESGSSNFVGFGLRRFF